MMNGSKISGKEYDRRMTALAESRSFGLESFEREEFEIVMDYRLGVLFSRRDELWAAKKRAERFKLYIIVRNMFDETFALKRLKSEYAKVLTSYEMNEFFKDRE